MNDLSSYRLAWLLHYGKWPPDEIDHINGVKTDNRICNLREANNQHNRGKLTTTTSGFIGVCWHKRDDKWHAYCKVNGKQHHIGCYDTPELAHQAYCKYHEEFFHG